MSTIEVNHLVKSYKNVKAVDDVSFAVSEGTICGILGPNGSGKTTTIKSICNLIIPDQGSIKLLGKDHYKALHHISALFEGTRNLYWRLTPRENLRYFAGLRGIGGKGTEKIIDELLERFGLESKKNVMVNQLSRGMQQKTAIAMTLVCNTEIILLDEPTLGLDVETTLEIKKVLKEIAKDYNKTVLLSTHDMHLVEDVCDEVILLNKGKVVVQDRVQNLIDMFKQMTYEINLVSPLSTEVQAELLNFYPQFIFPHHDQIEIDLSSYEEIYSIIDLLRSRNILIKEYKQRDVNFERIYLKYTAEVN